MANGMPMLIPKWIIEKLKKYDANLTADNDQEFRFGYDSETGKYGYYTGSGGADTFNPFSAGGIPVASIAVTTMPTKTSYGVGDTFDPTGMVVTATLEDSSTLNVKPICSYDPTTFTTVGTIPVTVDCYGYTTSINITCSNIYDIVKNASTVTEAQWIEFCNFGGIKMARDKGETSSFIGKNVTLSNTVVSNYTSWQIADFNHDSSGNTCDLIQNNTIYNITFGSTQYYADSTVRSWLTETYLPGFSTSIKNRLQTMSVVNGSVTTSDKIKILSVDEVGITSAHANYSYSERGGSRYPIFNAGGSGSNQTDSSRVRTGTNAGWWLRTRNTYNTSRAWYVGSDGSASNFDIPTTWGVLPALRFA